MQSLFVRISLQGSGGEPQRQLLLSWTISTTYHHAGVASANSPKTLLQMEMARWRDGWIDRWLMEDMDQTESGARWNPAGGGARRMILPQKWLSSFGEQKCFRYDSSK